MAKAFKKALAVLLAVLTMMGVGGVGAGAEEAEALAGEASGAMEAAAFPKDFDEDDAVELIPGVFTEAPERRAWFKFVPDVSGGYRVAGKRKYFSTIIDASLYDEKGNLLQKGGPWERLISSRIALYCKLEAGKIYYLSTYDYDDYAVMMELYEGTLVVKKSVTINMGQRISFSTLFEGTTWFLEDLVITSDEISWDCWTGTETYRGEKVGTESFLVTAPDGESVQFTIITKSTANYVGKKFLFGLRNSWAVLRLFFLFGWVGQLRRDKEEDTESWWLVALPLLPIMPFIILIYPFYALFIDIPPEYL